MNMQTITLPERGGPIWKPLPPVDFEQVFQFLTRNPYIGIFSQQ